jgi:predicted O-methyltransferase YrrM
VDDPARRAFAEQARRALEIGTSNGYSTIWLGDAVHATGGALVTLDIEPSTRTTASPGRSWRSAPASC